MPGQSKSVKKVKQIRVYERKKLEAHRFYAFGDYVNEQITKIQLSEDKSELEILFATDETIVVSYLLKIEK